MAHEWMMMNEHIWSFWIFTFKYKHTKYDWKKNSRQWVWKRQNDCFVEKGKCYAATVNITNRNRNELRDKSHQPSHNTLLEHLLFACSFQWMTFTNVIHSECRSKSKYTVKSRSYYVCMHFHVNCVTNATYEFDFVFF